MNDEKLPPEPSALVKLVALTTSNMEPAVAEAAFIAKMMLNWQAEPLVVLAKLLH
jgi:hypothetical protein